MTEEKEQEAFNEMAKYYDEQQWKWSKAKEELKGLIHPKYFDFAESNDTYYSEGVFEIEETDERTSGYSKNRHCRIKETNDSRLYMYTTSEVECYDFESEYEGEPVEYWVWQQTGYLGDDYSGFLLLPLLDGKRFWKIGYSC